MRRGRFLIEADRTTPFKVSHRAAGARERDRSQEGRERLEMPTLRGERGA